MMNPQELWLLRHAQASQDNHHDDFNRALTAEGVDEARRMGQWLRQQQLFPDIILSSPAKRAISTTLLVVDELNMAAELVQQAPQLYFQGAKAIKTVVKNYLLSHQRILVVAHNPDLEKLLFHLCGQSLALPTATFARFALDSQQANSAMTTAKLLSITSPSMLPKQTQ
jgi:phosphohistidine phosphatase